MAYEQLKLSNQLCFRLYTASRLITQSYKPLLDKLGITYPQYSGRTTTSPSTKLHTA